MIGVHGVVHHFVEPNGNHVGDPAESLWRGKLIQRVADVAVNQAVQLRDLVEAEMTKHVALSNSDTGVASDGRSRPVLVVDLVAHDVAAAGAAVVAEVVRGRQARVSLQRAARIGENESPPARVTDATGRGAFKELEHERVDCMPRPRSMFYRRVADPVHHVPVGTSVTKYAATVEDVRATGCVYALQLLCVGKFGRSSSCPPE